MILKISEDVSAHHVRHAAVNVIVIAGMTEERNAETTDGMNAEITDGIVIRF